MVVSVTRVSSAPWLNQKRKKKKIKSIVNTKSNQTHYGLTKKKEQKRRLVNLPEIAESRHTIETSEDKYMQSYCVEESKSPRISERKIYRNISCDVILKMMS